MTVKIGTVILDKGREAWWGIGIVVKIEDNRVYCFWSNMSIGYLNNEALRRWLREGVLVRLVK
jgi:hypothetical protein